ncbi:hypothetical protein HZA97_01470 [Candidatus Woesearchaeota archaeon]|nr:hypothetical protein [Candidatus Woesearchaeota archaeon]
MHDLNSIGIPINPNKHPAKKSLFSEFFEGLSLIFIGTGDIIGIIFSLIHAVIFILYWTLFLIERFILRLNIDKPKVKK